MSTTNEVDPIAVEQAAILKPEQSRELPLSDGRSVVVRVLTMIDLLDPAVLSDLQVVLSALMNGAASVTMTVDEGKDEGKAILALLLPVLDPVHRLLKRAVDGGDGMLAIIPHFDAPKVLEAFISLNFTGPALQPWVALLQRLTPAKAKAGAAGAAVDGTSGTSSSSSPAGDGTTAGKDTPSTSLSSGSGGPSDGS